MGRTAPAPQFGAARSAAGRRPGGEAMEDFVKVIVFIVIIAFFILRAVLGKSKETGEERATFRVRHPRRRRGGRFEEKEEEDLEEEVDGAETSLDDFLSRVREVTEEQEHTAEPPAFREPEPEPYRTSAPGAAGRRSRRPSRHW